MWQSQILELATQKTLTLQIHHLCHSFICLVLPLQSYLIDHFNGCEWDPYRFISPSSAESSIGLIVDTLSCLHKQHSCDFLDELRVCLHSILFKSFQADQKMHCCNSLKEKYALAGSLHIQ